MEANNKPNQPMQSRENVSSEEVIELFDDYETEPIGGGSPYHRCVGCGRSVPEINGRLAKHLLSCPYRIGKERRTTPPTQSQEGETDVDAAILQIQADTYTHEEHQARMEILARTLAYRLTAAQRENDRLRSEVAGLKVHLSQALRQWRGYAEGDLCADCDDPQDLTTADHAEGQVYRAAIKALAARAATEEKS